MMSQPISATPPEITSRLSTFGSGYEGRDQFLWEHLKNLARASVVNTAKERLQSVQNGSILTRNTPRIFQCVRQSMPHRAEACVAVQNQHLNVYCNPCNIRCLLSLEWYKDAFFSFRTTFFSQLLRYFSNNTILLLKNIFCKCLTQSMLTHYMSYFCN
jgi:hypothetical protein